MADFGEILGTIGDFGLFQKLVLFGLSFPNIILPFHGVSVLFLQRDPDRHCNTDWILRTDHNLTTDEQLNLTLPREQDGDFSRCLMFVPVDWDIDTIRDHGLNETTECQNGWVYDKTMYEATIVTDFDLVCGKTKLVGVSQTLIMTGVLVGALLFGPLAESLGRKRATQIPVVLMLIFTITTGLCPNFYLYAASQFVVGVASGGFRVNCIVLATEWIGVKRRALGACLSQIFGACGQCLLAALAFLIRDWRQAQFVIAVPVAVVAVYIWFIPESARWLLNRGRTEEVKQLVLKAAAINKRTVPDSLLEKIVEKKTVERSSGIRVLIRSPVLRKYFFIIACAWFSLSLAMFSLTFNVGNFGLNIFLTQLMFGLSELPAHFLCIWLLEVLGRKLSLMGTLLTGGLLCILVIAIPQGSAIAITALATIGRMFVTWAGTICNIYVQELFPTSVRQTATGLGSIAARIAGLLAPMLNLLVVFHWSIPNVVFSSLLLVSGVLIFLLPETRGTELPESTDGAEGNRNVSSMNKERDHKVDNCPYEHSTKL